MSDEGPKHGRRGLSQADLESFEVSRRMTPLERLQKAKELTQAEEDKARGNLQAAYPGASEREIFLRRAIERLGEELARKAYPEIETLLGPMPGPRQEQS